MAPVDKKMDNIDCALLNIIQSDFPIVSDPYANIAQQVGITKLEAFSRIQHLRRTGTIRRIGANFDSSLLGFQSTLCAAKVPSNCLDDFIAVVNACTGVTHNYLRNHKYNIWFTLIAPSWDSICTTIAELSQKTGINILNLPKTRLYKIKVNFEIY